MARLAEGRIMLSNNLRTNSEYRPLHLLLSAFRLKTNERIGLILIIHITHTILFSRLPHSPGNHFLGIISELVQTLHVIIICTTQPATVKNKKNKKNHTLILASSLYGKTSQSLHWWKRRKTKACVTKCADGVCDCSHTVGAKTSYASWKTRKRWGQNWNVTVSKRFQWAAEMKWNPTFPSFPLI